MLSELPCGTYNADVLGFRNGMMASDGGTRHVTFRVRDHGIVHTVPVEWTPFHSEENRVTLRVEVGEDSFRLGEAVHRDLSLLESVSESETNVSGVSDGEFSELTAVESLVSAQYEPPGRWAFSSRVDGPGLAFQHPAAGMVLIWGSDGGRLRRRSESDDPTVEWVSRWGESVSGRSPPSRGHDVFSRVVEAIRGADELMYRATHGNVRP